MVVDARACLAAGNARHLVLLITSRCAFAVQSSRGQSSARLELIDEDPVEQEAVSVQVVAVCRYVCLCHVMLTLGGITRCRLYYSG